MDTPSGYSRMGGAGRIGPYPDRSSCESVNSQYFNGGGTCSCSSSGSGSTGSSGYNRRQWEAEQEMLRQQAEAEQRRREAEEKKRKLDEAEEEARQRERARSRAFDASKREALESLKGASGNELTIKSGTPAFGIKPNPEGTLKEPGTQTRNISVEWKQAYCGMWIAGFTFPAAQKGDVEEVRYLGGQALKSLAGGPPELQCPDVPAPPKVAGHQLTGKDSPVFKFHEAVLRATEKQAERIRDADKRILEASLRKQMLQQEIEAKQKETEQLEAALKQEVSETNKAESQAAPAAALDKSAEKRRALAEAMAALKQAKQAATEVDALTAKAEKEKKAADAKLGEYDKLSQQVKAAPDKSEELVKKIGN